MTANLPQTSPVSLRHRIRRTFRAVAVLLPALLCERAAPEPFTPRWSSVSIGGGYGRRIVYRPTERNLRYARTDVGGAYRWAEAASRRIVLKDDARKFGHIGAITGAPRVSDHVYLGIMNGEPAVHSSARQDFPHATHPARPFRPQGFASVPRHHEFRSPDRRSRQPRHHG